MSKLGTVPEIDKNFHPYKKASGSLTLFSSQKFARSSSLKHKRENKIVGLIGDTARENTEFRQKLDEKRGKMLSVPPKRNQLYFIFSLILNQRIIVYKTCDALKYYFSCRQCRKQRSLKKYKSKDFYLNQGIQKL